MGENKNYWTATPTTQKELKELRKKKEKLEKEVEALTQKEILQENIKKAKAEKFKHSKVGRFISGGAKLGKSIATEIKKREPTDKEKKKFLKDIVKGYNSIARG